MKAIRSQLRVLAVYLFALIGACNGLQAQIPYVDVLAQQPADAKFSDVQNAIEKHFNQFSTKQ
jgi:hypothetical protein